jgi:Predicted periplasmic lipoprotein (DUF2279)
MTRTLLLSASTLALLTFVPPTAAPVLAQTTPDPVTEVAVSPTPDAVNEELGWWASQPKENKMLYTNLTAATLIGIWGFIEWDYGSEGWNTADEGWFEQDSKYGGADKLGHFWSTYAFADALTALYKSWGYSPYRANAYAALSAFTVQAIMEIGDGTSESQGFSSEDLIANAVGALASVLMEHSPELDRKIDFRVEYVFENEVNGIFDDYSNHYYSVVLKLDGFDVFKDNFMKFVEFHAGYYTRGYEDEREEDVRSTYVGIGFNFSRLLLDSGWEKTGKVLEYWQLPYTVPKLSNDLD